MPRNTSYINKPVTWHSEQGFISAIFLTRADKYIRILPLQGKLSVKKLPLDHEKHLTPIEFKGKPYPIKRAIRIFRKHAGIFGMTVSAKQALAQTVVSLHTPFKL